LINGSSQNGYGNFVGPSYFGLSQNGYGAIYFILKNIIIKYFIFFIIN